MALDSSAVFLERIVAIGLSPHATQFEALGWNTHGNFAYAASAPPGSAGGADAFSAEIAGPLLGADYGVHQDLAKIRRLHFESYTLAVADMNRMVNKTEDDDKPRTLPAPERALRMAALQEILGELEIDDNVEPADSLTDKFVAIQEKGTMRWVPWEECGRKSDEELGIKRDPTLKPDAAGRICLQPGSFDEVNADYSSDMKLLHTFQRRGVSMHIARLLHFRVHQKLVKWYMAELARIDPDFHKVSVHQLLSTDQAIFRRLGQLTRAGLTLDPATGLFPLDDLLPLVMLEPMIVLRLTPAAKPRGGVVGGGVLAIVDRERDSGKLKRKNEEVEKLKVALKRAKDSASGGGKGIGKDKNKGKDSKDKKPNVRLPAELIGLNPTNNGKRSCFGFNMRCGCNLEVDKYNECKKGFHECMRCGGNHPQHYRDCPKR